jgi:hypothetical protein
MKNTFIISAILFCSLFSVTSLQANRLKSEEDGDKSSTVAKAAPATTPSTLLQAGELLYEAKQYGKAATCFGACIETAKALEEDNEASVSLAHFHLGGLYLKGRVGKELQGEDRMKKARFHFGESREPEATQYFEGLETAEVATCTLL